LNNLFVRRQFAGKHLNGIPGPRNAANERLGVDASRFG
jgi:hypothetical protein